jgi:hypothetical protein
MLSWAAAREFPDISMATIVASGLRLARVTV